MAILVMDISGKATAAQPCPITRSYRSQLVSIITTVSRSASLLAVPILTRPRADSGLPGRPGAKAHPL